MLNPTNEARLLLESIGWTKPSDMSIEDIAWACGFVVNYKEMDGSQGRILMNSDEAIITINSSINYQPKINFVLAHEIGHGILHRQLSLFNDNEGSLMEWFKKGNHENEANAFASELLMPLMPFINQVKGRKLSFRLIEEVASYFGSSLIATFLRYKDIGDYPLMVVYIENGLIKWKSCSKDFPYQWLSIGSKLPPYTVAGDFYYNNVKESAPELISAIEWFPEDFNCQRSKGSRLWEQTFPVPSGIVSCIWTP